MSKAKKCNRNIVERLDANDIDKKRIWKQHMGKIMNEEIDWDNMTSADVV